MSLHLCRDGDQSGSTMDPFGRPSNLDSPNYLSILRIEVRSFFPYLVDTSWLLEIRRTRLLVRR